ncbi:MAG: DUF4920 domain-containing protein [Candidatus Sericytochromatia bacterium]
MKIVSATLALTTLLTLSSPVWAETVFGKAPALTNVIKISALLDNPEQYLNKEIRVEGIATDVCPMRGCWMKVQSDRKQQSLLIKVNDGEMVFPMSARGKHVVLQGKLVKKVMPVKDVIEIEKARAKKEGKPFDAASVKGPRISYVFQPSGVVIH